MDGHDFLARRFEEHRPHLSAVAHRLLGSAVEADDAVQEAWLRLARSGGADVDNLAGWLTTVVSRVCLDMLRSRQRRREDVLDVRLAGSVAGDGSTDPEHRAGLADSVAADRIVGIEVRAVGP